jgi:hypothetical protein
MLLWHFMNASSSGSCCVSDVSMAAEAASCLRRCPSSGSCSYSQYEKLKRATNTKSALVRKLVIFRVLPYLLQLRLHRILHVLQQHRNKKSFVNTILGLVKLIEMTPLSQINTIANGHIRRIS